MRFAGLVIMLTGAAILFGTLLADVMIYAYELGRGDVLGALR